MIVHFFTALSELKKENIGTLRHIMATIKQTGAILADDWFFLEDNSPNRMSHMRNWPSIYLSNVSSIERSDVVIAEASGYSSFGVGYQTAVALQKKKPTLLLQRADSYPPTGTYPEGIDDQFVLLKIYKNKQEASDFIVSFIKDNTEKKKEMRFNFVIDRHIHNHIRGKAFRTKKTKAEVVRELLLKDMKNED